MIKGDSVSLCNILCDFCVFVVPRVERYHKALAALLTSKVLNRRLTHLALYLQEFVMDIVYHPGSKNGNSDGLSRQEWVSDIDGVDDEDVSAWNSGEMSGPSPTGSCRRPELYMLCMWYVCKLITQHQIHESLIVNSHCVLATGDL